MLKKGVLDKMKKITNLLTLGVAVFSLAACASGNKVSEEKFREEVNNLPEHQYSEATLKVKSNMHMEMLGQSEDENVDSTFHYTWDADKKEWVAQEEDGKDYADNLVSVKDLNLEAIVPTGGEAAEFIEGEYEISYYVNPLKVAFKINGTVNTETEGSKINGYEKGSGSVVFDKYGFMTSCDIKIDMNLTMSGTVLGTEISTSMVMNGDMQLSASYK